MELSVNERLGDLEERQALTAQAIEELAPILARINGELIRAGLIPQREGLANQDGVGNVARLAAEAHVQATSTPSRPTQQAENGSLI